MRHYSRYIRLFAMVCVAGSSWALAGSDSEMSDSKSQSQASIKGKVAHLKDACKSDLKKYCSDITPGEGRLASCLESREDQLSDKCSGAMASTKAQISKQMDRTELAFRKSCGSDVNKFCSNVPSGRGRLLDCLGDHQDSLSDSCKKFGDQLNEKLSSMMG